MTASFLTHKVKINIADRDGHKHEVLQSEHLFGEFCEILVLTPGETVQGIESKEMDWVGLSSSISNICGIIGIQ